MIPQGVRTLGRDGAVLKCTLPRPGLPTVEALWWSGGPHAEVFAHRRVDLLGRLGESWFRGNRTLQLELADARVSGP